MALVLSMVALDEKRMPLDEELSRGWQRTFQRSPAHRIFVAGETF